MIHRIALFILPHGHKFTLSASYQQSEICSRSVSFHISNLFLLWIYSITTFMCMCNYMQEVNSTFVQYCVHSFPRKHEAGVWFYTQKTLSVTWALTVYLPGKSCLLSNCFLLWKVTDWKQKLTSPVSYMNLKMKTFQFDKGFFFF